MINIGGKLLMAVRLLFTDAIWEEVESTLPSIKHKAGNPPGLREFCKPHGRVVAAGSRTTRPARRLPTHRLKGMLMKNQPEKPVPQQGRRDRRTEERVHETSTSQARLPDPTRCPHCHAVFHHERWRWIAPPPTAHEAICPACQRIRDHNPAGFLTLSGRFLAAHQPEILNLAHNEEAAEKAEYPLHRIMDIAEGPDGILITTTDIHLPRRIGEALHHAYRGDLEVHSVDEDRSLRVHWQRE
jgi:hypothetical protein